MPRTAQSPVAPHGTGLSRGHAAVHASNVRVSGRSGGDLAGRRMRGPPSRGRASQPARHPGRGPVHGPGHGSGRAGRFLHLDGERQEGQLALADAQAGRGARDRGLRRPGERAAGGEVPAAASRPRPPRYTVRAFRMGWYGGPEPGRCGSRSRLPGRRQAPPETVAATRTVTAAHWKPGLAVDTSGWRRGLLPPPARTPTPEPALRPDHRRSRLRRRPGGRRQRGHHLAGVQRLWGGRSLYRGPGGFEDRSRARSASTVPTTPREPGSSWTWSATPSRSPNAAAFRSPTSRTGNSTTTRTSSTAPRG